MGTVYFVAAIDTDHETKAVKIGYCGGKLSERLRNLQTGSPLLLDLYKTVPGTLDTEAGFHRQFADCRIRGEWFEAQPVMAYIAESEGWGA